MLINSLVRLFFFQNKSYRTGRTNFLLTLPKYEFHEYFQTKLLAFRILSNILQQASNGSVFKTYYHHELVM